MLLLVPSDYLKRLFHRRASPAHGQKMQSRAKRHPSTTASTKVLAKQIERSSHLHFLQLKKRRSLSNEQRRIAHHTTETHRLALLGISMHLIRAYTQRLACTSHTGCGNLSVKNTESVTG